MTRPRRKHTYCSQDADYAAAAREALSRKPPKWLKPPTVTERLDEILKRLPRE